MRIFLSCQQSQRKHDVPAYQFWETYFKNGVAESAHEWTEAQNVDWAEGLAYENGRLLCEWRERTWNLTVDAVKRQHEAKAIDLFVSYLFPKQVEPRAIQEIRSLGIPCVNFFCDNVREFTRVPDEFKCFDLHWVPEFKAIDMYKRAALSFVHAPMPVWIPPHYRTCKHPEKFGVTFIGSRDTQREALFARAISLGVPLEIRGAGWNVNAPSKCNDIYRHRSSIQILLNQLDFLRTNGVQAWTRKMQAGNQPQTSNKIFSDHVRNKPDAEEYIKITQESLITLGVNRYPSFRHPFLQPDTYSRMRDLEAPMMGACYLTEYTEGLDSFYALGEDIETYHTADEMAEKVRMLSLDVDKRRKLRCRGQIRALSEHNVGSSLSKIAKALSIKE